jgi:acyl-CoA thioesterase FadM
MGMSAITQVEWITMDATHHMWNVTYVTYATQLQLRKNNYYATLM